MDHFLGIDGGGTKLRWRCVDESGSAVAQDEVAGVQPAVDGVDVAAAEIADLLCEARDAHAPVSIVVGLAGLGSAGARDRFFEVLRARGVADGVAVCGDVEIAAATVLAAGPGLAAWAGTGSFVLGRSISGELERLGGRGYLLGDRGGGFSIVRRAAVAAVEALDDLGPDTALGDALCEVFEISEVADLGAAMQARRPSEVARHAEVVCRVAESGDAVASRVLDDEAFELAALVGAVGARVDLPDAPCVVGGGVLRELASFRDRFTRALGGVVRLAERSELDGAIALARAVARGESPLADWVR